MVVDTVVSKEQLVEMLVDKGVYYENVELHCAQGARAIFSHHQDQTNISLKEGILLTTGRAAHAIGPNHVESRSGSNALYEGDADLKALANYSGSVRDRCVLEFDITPVGNRISFNYVFASEEYPEYVGSDYNDVFGFFVSGPGIKGNFEGNAANIATVGKKEAPVSVNTINYANEELAGLYNSNPRSETDSLGIQFDGFTNTLQASIRVKPCKTYHFKLAIADVSDWSYDSGVFIEKNSFSSNFSYAEKTLLAPPCGDACSGAVALNVLDGKPEDYRVSWFTEAGEPLAGGLKQDGLCPGAQLVAVIEPEKGGCQQRINIRIPKSLTVEGTLTASSSEQACDGTIKLNVSGGVPPYTYSWSHGGNQQIAANLCSGDYSVMVRDASGCRHRASFEVEAERDSMEMFMANSRGNNSPAEMATAELWQLVEAQNTLLFAQGDVRIRQQDVPFLKKMAKVLKANLKLHLKIVGHASSEGSPDANLRLSRRRAYEVRSFLMQEGVFAGQLDVLALGESNPLREEVSEADRKQNRRVELQFMP